MGTGIGPIPFEAVDAYARRFGFDKPDDFEHLYELVRAADAAYLETINKDRKRGDSRPMPE